MRRCGAARVEMRKRDPSTGPCASTVAVRALRAKGPIMHAVVGRVVHVRGDSIERATVSMQMPPGPGCPVRVRTNGGWIVWDRRGAS